jgi:hypothetical protein
MSNTDIYTLLQKWSEAKNEIVNLEKKIEKYKRIATSIMDQQGNNTVSSDEYTLRRKEMSRTTISKKNVPQDVWNKYSKLSKYKAYYLSEKTKKTK